MVSRISIDVHDSQCCAEGLALVKLINVECIGVCVPSLPHLRFLVIILVIRLLSFFFLPGCPFLPHVSLHLLCGLYLAIFDEITIFRNSSLRKQTAPLSRIAGRVQEQAVRLKKALRRFYSWAGHS